MPPSELRSHNWFGHFEVDDVDPLYAEIIARGATRSSPKGHVTTTDGHRIVFGQEAG